MRFTALLLLTSLITPTGCKSSQPQPAPASAQPATPQQSKSSEADPTKLDCKAISDPVEAEDCRFRKEVAADKKKHNSNYAPKRDPGSIKQP